MSFFKGYKSNFVYNEIRLQATTSQVWEEITNVEISKFKFPLILMILGIPKPLAANVIKEGVGGYRVAKFSNGATFQQEILEWDLNRKYRFSFNASSNFKVGHVMNLSSGPFQIETGGYDLAQLELEVHLILSSNYRLNGFLGKALHLPFRFIVYLFQIYLLNGIRQNLKTVG